MPTAAYLELLESTSFVVAFAKKRYHLRQAARELLGA